MVDHIWEQGQGVIVSVTGPGKMHLLSYGSTIHQSLVGTIPARPQGPTRFLVSHSYGFFKYAFFWEGNGDAVASYGPVLRVPVGKGWKEATCVDWGSSNFTEKDVTTDVAPAGQIDAVPCFVIPEL